LQELPPSMGYLTCRTDCNLSGNRLTSLPTTIGSLTLGGSLDLSGNNLATLPRGWARLQDSIGGRIFLGGNPVAAEGGLRFRGTRNPVAAEGKEMPEGGDQVEWDGGLSDNDSDKGNEPDEVITQGEWGDRPREDLADEAYRAMGIWMPDP
jgi:Leucine-rich repeat (LRR) protein